MSGGNLRRNLMRSILTISGVVVGIGAIVFLVSIGFGMQELATSKVANLDALTLLTVNPSQKEAVLNQDAVDKFKNIKGVLEVSPLLSFPSQISKTSGGESGDTVIYGINPDYFELEDINADYGNKKFSDKDAQEAIVSVASLKNLNLTDPNNALGQELNFEIVQVDENGNQKNADASSKIKLKIIGITKEETTKYAYVPLNIIKKNDSKPYNSVKIKVAKRDDMADVRKAVESMGFPTSSVKDTVDQINMYFTWIKGILGGFGVVALFVAEIGIFNTLTISLLERTHEIGIMKAIGGRNRDVAGIFAMEACLIGLIGGITGVFTGWIMGAAINALINFIATSVGGTANKLFSTPLWFAGGIVVISFLVSSIAGILPARRAAKLDPLEALRYE
jgi:putative ABC transport system permease protein